MNFCLLLAFYILISLDGLELVVLCHMFNVGCCKNQLLVDLSFIGIFTEVLSCILSGSYGHSIKESQK